jgi:hypothetical protein
MRTLYWLAIIFGGLVAAGWAWLDRVHPNLWWLPFAILAPIGLRVALLSRRRVDDDAH